MGDAAFRSIIKESDSYRKCRVRFGYHQYACELFFGAEEYSNRIIIWSPPPELV